MADKTEKDEDFNGLLDELAGLQKSASVDEEDMTGMGEKKDEDEDEGEEGDDEKIKDAASGDNEEGDGEELFGKSFVVTIEGEEVEAFNGEPMLKALLARAENNDEKNADLVKALSVVTTTLGVMQSTIRKQNSMIKSLQHKPAGRKSVVNVQEKNPSDNAAKVDQVGLMAKAVALNAGGKFPASQMAALERTFNEGIEPDAQTVAYIEANA